MLCTRQELVFKSTNDSGDFCCSNQWEQSLFFFVMDGNSWAAEHNEASSCHVRFVLGNSL